ncbi:hypothetical protein C1H46_005829 [Malus baccata]|uniref:non-specific serine/threonine protein kinase n=1 Tax=Malus baccata TaxID=106549 RepID=A0A540ND49_MALBA|nr:hypothetical protein C1H46_005829 [Malus baccata]
MCKLSQYFQICKSVCLLGAVFLYRALAKSSDGKWGGFVEEENISECVKNVMVSNRKGRSTNGDVDVIIVGVGVTGFKWWRMSFCWLTCSLNLRSSDSSNPADQDTKSSFSSCLYFMKIIDKEALAMKKKMQRAEMERKILKMLDHLFLPTLHVEFEASHFSCIVMEYCSSGDLYSLHHIQLHKRFSVNSARFYAAEVLVALEYLYMLRIIYRDLKLENMRFCFFF